MAEPSTLQKKAEIFLEKDVYPLLKNFPQAEKFSLSQEIKVLKDATLNNMVNNVFLKNFDSVDAVLIISGVFDPVARKIYV